MGLGAALCRTKKIQEQDLDGLPKEFYDDVCSYSSFIKVHTLVNKFICYRIMHILYKIGYREGVKLNPVSMRKPIIAIILQDFVCKNIGTYQLELMEPN